MNPFDEAIAAIDAVLAEYSKWVISVRDALGENADALLDKARADFTARREAKR